MATLYNLGGIILKRYQESRMKKSLSNFIIIIVIIFIASPAFCQISDSVHFYLEKGGKAFAKDQFPEALQYYSDALRLDSLNLNALRNLGVLYSLKKDHQKSLEYLLKAERLDSTDAGIYNSLGVTYSNLSDTANAMKNYRRAVALKPDKMEYVRNLAALLIGENELNEAQSMIAKALENDTTDAEAYYMLGKILIAKKDYQGAEQYLEKMVSLKPWELKYLFLQAFNKEKLHKVDEAQSIYERIVTLEPKHFDARERLGVLYITMKRYPDALAQFEEAAKIRPTDLDVQLMLGAAYYFNAKPDESQEIYKMLKEKDPDRAEQMIKLIKVGIDERLSEIDSTESKE
jgi:tetratricopeptide (TPR) repeat protein